LLGSAAQADPARAVFATAECFLSLDRVGCGSPFVTTTTTMTIFHIWDCVLHLSLLLGFFSFESSSYPTFITSFLNPHCIYTIICSFLSASPFEYSSLHSTIVLWRRRGRPANYTLVAPTPTMHMYARCIVTHSLIIITSSSPHCLKRPIHCQSEPKDSGEEDELKPS